MKHWQIRLTVATLLGWGVVSQAAPVPSYPPHPTLSRQHIETLLAEQTVAARLQAMGLTRWQVEQRLATLSEPELEALAQQLERIHTGGMIQGGNPRPAGVLRCILQPFGRFLYNLFQLIFCWGRFDID